MKNPSIGRVIPINKPRGISSYAVVHRLKKLFPGEKIGHAGTLDPLAEGVLLILVGKATKLQEKLMGLKKEYEVELILGLESETYDLEGKIKLGNYPELLKKLSSMDKEKIEKALRRYRGKITQTVPAFSAVKVNGKPLYKSARRGITLKDLPAREVFLYRAEVLSFSPLEEKLPRGGFSPQEALGAFPSAQLRLLVSKGFYIRSLVHDLGKDLGVGALVSRLVRTRVGPYSLKKAFSLEEFLASGGRLQR